MAKRLIYRRRTKRGSRFAKKSNATEVWANGKRFAIHPKAGKKERQRVFDKARKYLNRVSFSDKVAEKLPTPSTFPGEGRRFLWWRGEPKTLNVPGKRNQTFDIYKWYFEISPPVNISLQNKEKVVRDLKNNFYPKALSIFESGKNYLFRIDTAYKDNQGFARTTAYLKAGKDGLSDGRGFSIGRHLELETKAELISYLNDTFDAFLKGFETYIGRKGIISGQINALTLEIS